MLVSSRLRLFTEGFGEQRWRNKADAGMAPLSVVENLNVFLNRGLCLSTGGIAAMMDKLILQRAPEAFYRLTGGCGKASTGLLAPFVELGADFARWIVRVVFGTITSLVANAFVLLATHIDHVLYVWHRQTVYRVHQPGGALVPAVADALDKIHSFKRDG